MFICNILCIIGSLVPKRKAGFSFCLSLPIISGGAFKILQQKFGKISRNVILQEVFEIIIT